MILDCNYEDLIEVKSLKDLYFQKNSEMNSDIDFSKHDMLDEYYLNALHSNSDIQTPADIYYPKYNYFHNIESQPGTNFFPKGITDGLDVVINSQTNDITIYAGSCIIDNYIIVIKENITFNLTSQLETYNTGYYALIIRYEYDPNNPNKLPEFDLVNVLNYDGLNSKELVLYYLYINADLSYNCIDFEEYNIGKEQSETKKTIVFTSEEFQKYEPVLKTIVFTYEEFQKI